MVDVIIVCFFFILLLNIEVTKRENQYNAPSSKQCLYLPIIKDSQPMFYCAGYMWMGRWRSGGRRCILL